MTPHELQQRQAVVSEALSWRGTPYHHLGRVKGIGVDCVMLLLETYERTGLIPHRETSWYTPKWSDRRNAAILMRILGEYARQVREALPGDGALFRIGGRESHLAIVIDWPEIVHSLNGLGVIRERVDEKPSLQERFLGFYRFNGWE